MSKWIARTALGVVIALVILKATSGFAPAPAPAPAPEDVSIVLMSPSAMTAPPVAPELPDFMPAPAIIRTQEMTQSAVGFSVDKVVGIKL